VTRPAHIWFSASIENLEYGPHQHRRRVLAARHQPQLFDVEVAATFKAGASFTARGFSYSTIKALVRAGLDAPERLLVTDRADLLLISGLDEQAFREIARYRSQFKKTSLNVPAAQRLTPTPSESASTAPLHYDR
jgi:hypothetical protein